MDRSIIEGDVHRCFVVVCWGRPWEYSAAWEVLCDEGVDLLNRGYVGCLVFVHAVDSLWCVMCLGFE